MRGLYLVALAASLAGVVPTLAAQEDRALSPLPAKVVAAWKEAGAQVGWLRQETFGYLAFRQGSEGKKGEVPAFRFREWKEGVIGKLPAPERSFGLSFYHTEVTDTGLKELAGEKH